jgi:methylase of polypeptide subunit release factors
VRASSQRAPWRAIAKAGDRQDTAASVSRLVALLHNAHKLPPELRLLDLCTGTACIPLLFQHELSAARDDVKVQALGVDVSDEALELARLNIQKLGKNRPGEDSGQLELIKADVLLDPFADLYGRTVPFKTALNRHGHPPFWDILISNPPYISPAGYWKTTTRSVRGYEPKLALVPPFTTPRSDAQQGDMFYPRLLEIARDVEAKIVLLEVADLEQAYRVVRRARALDIFDGMEIWREDPLVPSDASMGEDDVPLVGKGNARSVLCWRGAGSAWLGKDAGQDDAARLFHSSSGRLPSDITLSESMEPQFDPSLWGEELSNAALARVLAHVRNRRKDWSPIYKGLVKPKPSDETK